MLSKTTKRLLLCILMLSLAAGGFGAWSSGRNLEHVTAAIPQEDRVVLLDRDEKAYHFLLTDAAGTVYGKIDCPIREKTGYRRFDCLTRDGEQVYVTEYLADVRSDRMLAETVYRCDFGKGRLETAWELPVLNTYTKTNLAVQVREGVLTCFRSDYTGRMATGTMYRAQAGGEPEECLRFRYDIGVGFSDFYAASDGKAAFTTPAGDVYLAAETGEPRKIYPTGSRPEPLVLLGDDGADRLCVVGTDGEVTALDLAASGRAEKLFSFAEREIPLSGITSLALDGENGVIASVRCGGAVLLSREESVTTLAMLAVQPGRAALRGVLCFLAVWAAAGVLALLWRFFLFLTRGKMPIVTKLLAAFLPILVISLVSMNAMVTQMVKKEMVDAQYAQLFLLTQQQTATMNASYIRDVTPAAAYDSVYFYELRAGLNVLPEQGTLLDPTTEAQQQVDNSTYFWMYKLMGDRLVSLVCEQSYVGVPVEDTPRAEIGELFYRAASTGETIRTGYRDDLGDWSVLLTPVMNEEGKTVAVIESGCAQQSLDYAVEQVAGRLTSLNLTILAVLAVLLSGVIAYSLYPLGALRQRVQEISDGKLGVQTPVRGNDEVSEIARTFNTMSRNVAFRDKEIRLTSEGYSRFVPARVFGLLDRSSVIDVHLEDQTSVEATVLNCVLGSFDDIARNLRSKEMFRLINQVLARLVPVVNETGGLVDRFDRAGLLAIYTERSERALDAAVTLCQALRTADLEDAEGQSVEFHVTLSAGPAMIGIVGAEERLEAMTISEHTSFSRFLQPLAAEYGAAVLMTGSAAGQIEDFSRRYHARTIGFVYMRTLDKLERLYDVFDGDDETTRQLKEETKEQFEKGVALFCAHQYYDARLLFIEVLKKNRRDKAAKNYLYLCDTCYRQERGEEQNVWLETY